MPLIDLLDWVFELASCGAEALPTSEKPKGPYWRLFRYVFALVLFFAVLTAVLVYFDAF